MPRSRATYRPVKLSTPSTSNDHLPGLLLPEDNASRRNATIYHGAKPRKLVGSWSALSNVPRKKRASRFE
jgi:hypothetical protein